MNFTVYLLQWYHEFRRDLPWRKTKDPYKIWISEIIFQQTRISQGFDYYKRFIKKFPDIVSLALASEEEVLKQWQGLGYYSRARNLHASARVIHHQLKNQFPSSYQEIKKLKGVGDYTAAAIASIAFGIPEPVVDGNVLRFVSRYAGITDPVDSQAGKKAVLSFCRKMIGQDQPGDFNQAMMEFGALHCRQNNPQCETCPFLQECYAYRHQLTAILPIKEKKTKIISRWFSYLVICNDSHTWIRKRTDNDIWKNLYEFPMIESSEKRSLNYLKNTKEWKEIFSDHSFSRPLKISEGNHLLTHRRIHYVFYRLDVPDEAHFPFLKVKLEELAIYPVPKPVEKVFSYLCTAIKEFQLQMDDGPAKYNTLNIKP